MDSKENEMKNFEKDVYMSISKCLSQNETIKFNKYFDFYVPDGVRKLGWYEGTYIEVKYRLIAYSIDRIKQVFDLIQAKKLIIIFMDDDQDIVSQKKFCDLLDGREIRFMPYSELYIIASSPSDSLKDDKEEVFIKGKEKNNLDKAKEALKNDKVSLFLGAGVSVSVGSMNWDKLLEQLLKKRKLTIDPSKKCAGGLEKGRYIIDDYIQNGSIIPADFYRDMRSCLYDNIKRKPNDLIESIAKLITECKIESVITYNYDNLIEQEINDHPNKYNKILCRPIYDKSAPIAENCQYIYHVHGFISNNDDRSQDIILGEKEYHKVYQDSYNWSNVEQLHALNRSTCFFIGLSMIDPNLRRLLDISFEGSDKDPVHYAFLFRNEFDVPFTESVMHSFGVNCIWYDNHNDLPGLLNSLI